MKLTSLQLENIKSYRHAEVHFTSGVNAVCGANGSGKTTILEAIGFALFNYLPYDHKAFLREGEKTGTVRVRLLAADGREYEVVRRIGGGNAYYVYDVELGIRLAERGENVLDWVYRHGFDIEGAGSPDSLLKALFKNAVGVPQGTMTADFLGTPVTRQAIFNPLLRVEEYRDAYEQLKDTVSHLRQRSVTVGEQIARLETETERIPDAEDVLARLQEQRRESEASLARLTVEIEAVEEQKAALDAIADRLRTLQADVQARQYDVQRRADVLQVQEQSVAMAREARQAVQEAEPGYRLVIEARRRLAELEEQRTERDRLVQQRTAASEALRGIQADIERLDADLQAAVAAGEAAAQLAGEVERQQELEHRLADMNVQLREAAQLDESVTRLRREVEELERVGAERQKRLEEAAGAEQRAAGLAAARERLDEAMSRHGALKPLQEQLAQAELEGKRLRQQRDKVASDLERRSDFLSRMAQKQAEADRLDALLEHQRKLGEEQAGIAASMKYQDVARNALEKGQCPLLEVDCPVVAASPRTLDRFQGRLTSLRARLEAVQQELAGLDRQVETARRLEKEAQALAVQAAQLSHDDDELAQLDAELERARKQYAELKKVVDDGRAVQAELPALRREVEGLQAASKLAALRPDLEEQQRRDGARLEQLQADLVRTEDARRALKEVDDKARALEAELQALDDPRGRQHKLLSAAETRATLEQRLADAQGRLQDKSDELRAVVANLQPFAALDEEIEEQRRRDRDHAADYERYLQNEAEARQLEEREQLAAATGELLRAAQAAVAEAERLLAETSNAYDRQQHDDLTASYEALKETRTAEKTKYERLGHDLAVAEEDLAYLRRQEEKLLRHVAERDEIDQLVQAVGFVRETIKAAGPAITETLLANISQIANDIYAEIMDDHAAELRWDRDYEVLVQKGAETRRFSQLSGGEQMSAALAVRLALLKEMSEVEVAFFDEPTQNMDSERRGNLADQISQVRGFDQLIVISHDDTFEHHTDNLIRLRKEHDETLVEAS